MTVCPPTVRVPERAGPALAATLNVTLVEPVNEVGETPVRNALFDEAVQPQPALEALSVMLAPF